MVKSPDKEPIKPTPLIQNPGPDYGKPIKRGGNANTEVFLDQIGLPRSASIDFLNVLVDAIPDEDLSAWLETPPGSRIRRSADVVRLPRRKRGK